MLEDKNITNNTLLDEENIYSWSEYQKKFYSTLLEIKQCQIWDIHNKSIPHAILSESDLINSCKMIITNEERLTSLIKRMEFLNKTLNQREFEAVRRKTDKHALIHEYNELLKK